MEDRALVVERFALFANTLLAGAESAEVLSSLRHLRRDEFEHAAN